jgi:hypothetical protein
MCKSRQQCSRAQQMGVPQILDLADTKCASTSRRSRRQSRAVISASWPGLICRIIITSKSSLAIGSIQETSQYDSSLADPVSLNIFHAQCSQMVPVFTETDGACSGYPGPGGWVYILGQQRVCATVYGGKNGTTNSEIEPQAIEEVSSSSRIERT